MRTKVISRLSSRGGFGRSLGLASLGSASLGAAILGSLLAGPVIFTTLSLTAAAQTADRSVQGKVELSNGSMAKGAIVYLKNAKTLEIRTYISTDDGSYRFGQLRSDVDYTLWAELQGKKSKEKTISSFDNKKAFDFVLKLGS